MPTLPRYLVIAPQGLGDALEATPLVAALRNAHPHAAIDVVTLRPSAKLLFDELRPLVDDVVYLPYWEQGVRAFIISAFKKRWRRRYDVTFLCYPAARREYHVLSRLFPSRLRVAHMYEKPSLRNGLRLHNHLVPIAGKHNVLRNMDLLSAAGIQYAQPDSYVLPQSWKAARLPSTKKRLAIHVGTIKHDGLEARRWALERFTAVARHFASTCDVWIVMGPDEKAESEQLNRDVPQTKLFQGDLKELARFLGTCDAVLTNDSGVGHLAAATGAPLISLFGPTPLEHAPFGPNSFPLRLSSCTPCFDPRLLNTGCALNIGYRCLNEDLPVDSVIGAIDRLLSNQISAAR